MLLFALTTFLSAFLLFQVQPMIAKMILPWFGGSSAVWSTCMLFFQAALLAGYSYAHFIQRLPPRRQVFLHAALLAVSLATLPILPNPAWKTGTVTQPSLQILGLLTLTVGLPYFLLSTTSPLIQSWYGRTHSGAMPYRLFALSNFGSMLALMSYPSLVEPNLATRRQGIGWSLLYAAFVTVCAITAWRSANAAPVTSQRPSQSAADDDEHPGWTLRLLWIALSGCASILLLAITSFLTQDVAAIPFLWIAPLIVYLISFIVCFEAPQLYSRKFFLPLTVLGLGGLAYLIYPDRVTVHAPLQILIGVTSLFAFCMVCHGELVRIKPHPRYLTAFYMMLSLGGACGGLFVGLIAPNVFNAYYELPIGLFLCAALSAFVIAQKRVHKIALAVAVLAYAAVLVYDVRLAIGGYRLVTRNFYSQLRVRQIDDEDPGPKRKLLHGVINHGEQIMTPQYRRKPVTYFCPPTGVGRAMTLGPEGTPRRVGILGLGCGTLLAYGRPGDVFRVYEINPQVLDIARSEFTYLQDSPAKVETVLGDGRLSLEAEPDQHFDVLVMDAFSGDSVPVHLITVEAFQTYFRHLKPGGMLALNVSNKYLDLKPVMERAARHFSKQALFFSFEPKDDDDVCFGADWVLLTDRGVSIPGSQVLRGYDYFRPWTDDFSNLLAILK